MHYMERIDKMKVLSADEMYSYEKSIMEEKGVPSIVLMESASRAVIRQMKMHITRDERVLVAAGGGNNGGDSIASGRILHNEGFKVDILIIGNPNHYSEQNRLQQDIAINYGLQLVTDYEKIDFSQYDVLVDGLFGIGLDRAIEGPAKEVVKQINEQSSARTYAIDVPSGISAVSGQAFEEAIQADETITFGFYKAGMEKVELKNYFGEITVDDIGFFF